MRDDLIDFFIIGFGIVSVIATCIIGVQWIDVTFVDNIPSVVKVDGKTVYKGTSAGFDIKSSGANTTITIRGGFLYMFPKAYYTSSKVEIIGKKP